MNNLKAFKFLPPTTILLLAFIFVMVTGDLHGFQIDGAQEINATVRYVTTDGNCGVVTPCYSTVQSAVDAANTGDEIRVAAGTYTGVTTKTTLNQTNFTARQLVAITKTITLRGGYTAADWSTSDPATNETILDAERNGRVMVIMGEISPVVEGFTMTNGDATNLGGKLIYDGLCEPLNYPDDGGGGIYVTLANPIIRNNKITSNRASTANWAGGGGIMLNCSSATITQNQISTNTGHWAGRGKGGGIFAVGNGNVSSYLVKPVISNNEILFNTAGSDDSEGGGIYLGEEIGATITNNLIQGNEASSSAGGSGGGIYAQFVRYQSLEVNSNTILLNQTGPSSGAGGGISINYVGPFTLNNNIIADNYGSSSLRVYGLQTFKLDGHITNNTITTFYSNSTGLSVIADTFVGSTDMDAGTISLINNIFAKHSEALDVWAKNGMTVTINADHTLWDGNGSYITTYGTGEIVNTSNDITGDPALIPGSYRLTSTSDAVDSGADAGLDSDIDGNLRPIGKGVDIGADELYIESVIPTSGGTIDGTDAQGNGVSIDVPAGAVDQSTTFYLTPQAAIDQSHTTLSFAGHIFDLYAEQNGSVVSNFTFLTPVTLTITYADEDVAGIGENTLQLLYWNGSAWSADGITFVSRDTANNSLTVTIDHLTEFAMFGESYQVYLPAIVK